MPNEAERAVRLADAILTLDMYAANHVQPGGFMIALLSNDLMGAVSRADDVSIECIGEIARYIYAHLPRACWGSPRAVEAWLSR